MDGDFTHEPRYIPDLLAEAARGGADVVVGSRYLLKSSLDGWNPWRKALTRIGHLLTRALLQMPYDATNAFRCYRLDKIPRQLFDVVVSRGLFVLLREPVRAPPEPLPDHGGSDPPSQPHLRQLEDDPAGSAQQRAAPLRDLLQGPLQPGEVRRRRRGRGCRHGEQPARRPGLGRLLGCAEDRRRSLALRRRGRFLSEVDHPAGPESIRAPLLQPGRAAAARGLRRRTGGRRHPPRGLHHGARHLPERASAVPKGQPRLRPGPPRQHLRDPAPRRRPSTESTTSG